MLKFAGHHKHREMQVYLVNYIIAGVAAFFLSDNPATSLLNTAAIPDIIFGMFVGLLYVSNLIIMGRSVNSNGIGLTVSVMRISLVIPVIVSIVIFMEATSNMRIIGLVIAFIALGVLFKPSKKEKDTTAILYLVAIFIITGIGDVSLKIFQTSGSMLMDKWQFMGIIFLTSGLICFVLSLFESKPMPKRGEVLSGVLLGVPNLLASIFIIMALERVPASVTFPTANLTIIVIGTLVGRYYWKDMLTRRHYVVISLSVIAILLLTMDL